MEAQPQAQGQAATTATSLLSPMAETTHIWRHILKYSRTLETTPSWEEKAFANDTAAVPGGSVWPPRSYSCNFCMREFRSAQALGGHMNVHRRDRARLQNHTTTNTNSPLLFKNPPRVFIKPHHFNFNALKNNSNTSHSGKRPKLSVFSSSSSEEEELDLELRLGDPSPRV